MSFSPFVSLEVANDLIRERLQEAANDALADRLSARARARSSSFGGSLRLRLAVALRRLAVRLDPSLGCDSSLAVLSTSR
jgi:hypothetical protein